MKKRIPTIAGLFVVVLVALWITRPILPCFSSCLLDLETGGADGWDRLAMADVRLNAWILAWDQYALFRSPFQLFDANIFYPARNTLAGSEHLLGVALQVLPGHFVNEGAVFGYNVAFVMSYVLLGGATYFLVFRLTSNAWAATIAGVLQVAAPWRLEALPHLQLLSAQWIPVIWMLLLKHAEGLETKIDTISLFVVTTIQLLSCYYLAYMLTFSVAVLVSCLMIVLRPRRKSVIGMLFVLGLAYSIFAVTSIPYLLRDAAGGLVHDGWPTSPVGSVWILRHVWPPVMLPSLVRDVSDATSWVVLPVWLFSLAALAWLASVRQRLDSFSHVSRSNIAVIGALVIVALASVLLAIGPGEGSWSHALANLFESCVPGYDLFRVARRWLILFALCAAILAGLGVAALFRVAAPLPRQWSRVLGACCLAFALVYVPIAKRPTTPALGALESATPAYRYLAELPPGPVLEIPWGNIETEAVYQLASTRHWKPILNGYTGYPPLSYPFLIHHLDGLPRASQLETLSRLTAVRWILVHRQWADEQPWLDAALRGELITAYRDEDSLIYEVPERTHTGNLKSWMVDKSEPEYTFRGSLRQPVDVSEDDGRLQLLAMGDPANRRPSSRLPIELRIENRSESTWPAADFRRDGMIEILYEYRDLETDVRLLEGSAMLFDDVVANQTVDVTFLAAPIHELPSEPAVLVVKLAQRRGVDVEVLGLEAATRELPRLANRHVAPSGF